eukprot:822008_1
MATSTSDVQSQLDELWTIQESDRKRGTKLLSKILSNLSNNLSKRAKYGNLNCTRISDKLSRCKPVFVLLLRAGFKQSNDGKRLIWTYDDGSLKSLHDVYNALQAQIAIDLLMDKRDWQCRICKFKSKDNEKSCKMCQTSRANHMIQKGWQCRICTNINISSGIRCACCESEQGSWTCVTCTFKNTSTTKQCLICNSEQQPSAIRLSFASDSRMCNKRGGNSACIIENCECLQRMRVAMRHFNLVSNEDGNGEENKEIFVSFCNETYKNQHLLDDYCHIIQEHSNDLIQIKNELINKYAFDACDVNQCHKVKRYYGRPRRTQPQEHKEE